MERYESTSDANKIHSNRLSSITEDEEQDAALTIVTVLDKVATVVEGVRESQKRIEERHREMENVIKSVQIDVLKISQCHSNTSYAVDKLLEKTRKVSARVKEVKARVEKQNLNVRKVEATQEEMLKKNKFRVVIFQEEMQCPTSLSVVKERTLAGNLEDDEFCFPDDLSSDEEYHIEESRTSKFRKSGMRRIANLKKAFSKENMQKTRQNFDKKVNRIRTRIVTPERRERVRQSGERLRQSGERLKKSISKAAPNKDTFKMYIHKKEKERTGAEGQEGLHEKGGDAAAEPAREAYTDVLTPLDREQAREAGEEPETSGVKTTLKPQTEPGEAEVLLLDLKQSA
ncbi:caveolae-associated protein 4 [Tachyglossus aculeatus]|uniref:caveolae-associated protein 4 n=1 Tax=Tachyglossus aculeatus TaxID=9261 RepID=UPI0018F4796B|nr:caveolae-associated protein 4 [Tachyglossus aculeatus]